MTKRERDLGIDKALVTSLFHYEAATGAMRWTERPVSMFDSLRIAASWNGKHAGRLAGCADDQGYWKVTVQGARFGMHRLIWIMHHGEIPDGHEIDHLNGVRNDNRIENLRLVTHAANCKNARRENVPSGFSGVSWNVRQQKWIARVGYNMQRLHLGVWDNKADAERVVATVKRALGYTERAVA